MDDSYVYIFLMKDKTSLKIGKSNNPSKRFKELIKYYNLDIKTSRILKCNDEITSFKIERTLHKIFENNRVLYDYDGGTEFFDYNIINDLDLVIDILLDRHDIQKLPLQITLPERISFDNVDMIIKKLGNSIKRKRMSMMIKQKQLSSISGVKHSTLKRIERGHSGTSINNIIKIMNALNMDDIFDSLYNDGKKLNCRVRR